MFLNFDSRVVFTRDPFRSSGGVSYSNGEYSIGHRNRGLILYVLDSPKIKIMNTKLIRAAVSRSLCAVTLAAFATHLIAPASSGETVPGLVAHFPFNGNANDASGNGLNGNVLGATLTTDRFGLADSAYHIASGEYLTFPSLPALGGANTAFTVSLWFQAQGTGSLFTDYGGTQTGGDNVFAVNLSIGENPTPEAPFYVTAASRNNPSYPLDYTSLPPPSAPLIDMGWHALAYQMNGVDSCLVFLDGAQVATLPYDSSLNYSQNPQWQAGHLLFAGEDQFFTGKIDDIQIYGRALSSSEIREVQQVPEPTSLTLVALGLLGATALRRREAVT